MKENVRFALCLLFLAGFVGLEYCAETSAVVAPGKDPECTRLKDTSDSQVAACNVLCPDQDTECAKTSCITLGIARWVMARDKCETSYPQMYYRNPTFPPLSTATVSP